MEVADRIVVMSQGNI
ncbi:hypothetical protein SSYM_2564, partial [Serratia symbiotica str. Tucson]